MANEFIARKGLIVLANGAKVTGSLGVQGDIDATGYNVTASNLQLSGNANIDGNVTIGGNITVGNADIDVVKFLAEVSSSIIPDVNNAFDLGSGSKYWKDLYVSGTAYIGSVEASNINLDSITVLNNLTVDGNTKLGNQSTDTVSITGSVVSSGPITAPSFSGSFSGSGAQITNIPNSGLDNSSVTVTAGSGLSGGGAVALGSSVTVSVDSGSMLPYYSSSIFGAVSGDILINSSTGVATIQPDSVALGTDTTGDYVATITAGSGINSTGGSSGEGTTHTLSVDTSSAHFTGGVKQKLDADSVVSSSAQIDVTQTTNYATLATTGSNTFTGIQTISNTTNSTTFADGALIVQGGVGIAKDVNISGSLTVDGLLTVVSMSTQYVTSSQYTIGVSRVILNDDDLVRFAGISVVDSGSTYGTGSLLWDSFNNRWIAESDDANYESATLILGPAYTGTLGDEPSMVNYRVPVGFSDHHIDNRVESSSIRVDFPSRLTHIEAGLYVTGAVTSSVGFSGDGSQLTGIVTNLNLSGSEGGTGTISLKTQALTISGSNGIAVTANGQTVTISGSNATTTSRGVASFNSGNFAVTNGEVTSNPINFNGANINLGGTHAFGLQNITPYGASTTDQVSLQGGAIIAGVLFTTASNPDVDSGTEVVASVSTGSYDSAFFDYVVKKSTNYRVGTVMAVWDNANNVEYTDTSTNDLGDTTDVVFTVDVLSGNARLKATVTTNDWVIKTAVRAL
jgi:hypothetical protein